MALGYQNPFYLKQAQKKQQSLYDGKVLLEKHDPPVVHDSEVTLQLAQESRDKMKQMNKEIKPANYTKINHLSGGVQNCKIQFLKEAAKFVGDFQSLAKEADDSLAKHKALELEIERLLKAVVRVDNTKTRRPQPRSNTKHDRVPSTSKSSRSKNKEAENVYSKVVCAMCKQYLISVNHDECLLNYVNDKKSGGKKQSKNVQSKKNKRNESRRWSPTGRMFDINGKIIASSEFESQSDYSKGDNACTSNPMEPTIKRFPNSTFSLFMGTVRFENDHVAAIMGFGDLQWGNILITRVYFVKGLGHNFFSVGQFCDSNLEVAFRRNACFVRNLEGVDLLKRDHSTNLYTINLHEMASASPICLMAHASSTKSWLWHQRLSHLNFDTINDLARNDLVASFLKFKYHKEHLCPSCEQGKSKRASHLPKPVPNSRQRLHLLYMDLCGPMRIASTNRKRNVLVIVDDYSCYTWVHFLRSKDEAPEVIIKFLKRITVLLQSPVIIIRTDSGTKFKNQVLKEYFDTVGISHQMSSVRTPQQNGVVERRNQTLVEAARTMLIFSRAPLFL
nr:hypothetical protein [Tanacetum cinerariifolium]